MTHNVVLKYDRDCKTWVIKSQIRVRDDALMNEVAEKVMRDHGVDSAEVIHLTITPIKKKPWWKFF